MEAEKDLRAMFDVLRGAEDPSVLQSRIDFPRLWSKDANRLLTAALSEAREEGRRVGLGDVVSCYEESKQSVDYAIGRREAFEETLEVPVNVASPNPDLVAGYRAGVEAYREAIRTLAGQPLPKTGGSDD